MKKKWPWGLIQVQVVQVEPKDTKKENVTYQNKQKKKPVMRKE